MGENFQITNSILSIPSEIFISNILNHLSIDDLVSLCKTCKKFKDTIYNWSEFQKWKNVMQDYFMTYRIVDWTLYSEINLHSILSYFTDNDGKITGGFSKYIEFFEKRKRSRRSHFFRNLIFAISFISLIVAVVFISLMIFVFE